MTETVEIKMKNYFTFWVISFAFFFAGLTLGYLLRRD